MYPLPKVWIWWEQHILPSWLWFRQQRFCSFFWCVICRKRTQLTSQIIGTSWVFCAFITTETYQLHTDSYPGNEEDPFPKLAALLQAHCTTTVNQLPPKVIKKIKLDSDLSRGCLLLDLAKQARYTASMRWSYGVKGDNWRHCHCCASWCRSWCMCLGS